MKSDEDVRVNNKITKKLQHFINFQSLSLLLKDGQQRDFSFIQ